MDGRYRRLHDLQLAAPLQAMEEAATASEDSE